MLRSLVSRFTRGGGAAGRARPTATGGGVGTRGAGGGAGGKRGQNEAIGRGVRSLLRKVR